MLIIWDEENDEHNNYMGSRVMVKNCVQNLANIFETPKAQARLTKRTLQTALGIASTNANAPRWKTSNDEKMVEYLEKKLRQKKPFAVRGSTAHPITEMDIRAQLTAMAEDEQGMPSLNPTAVMKVKSALAASHVDVWIELSEIFGTSDPDGILEKILKQGDEELKMKYRSVALLANFQNIRTQAMKKLSIRRHLDGKTYVDRLLDEKLSPKTLNKQLLAIVPVVKVSGLKDGLDTGPTKRQHSTAGPEEGKINKFQ